MQSHRPTQKIYVLACNIPNEQYADKYRKKLIQGVQKRWGDNVCIIYLDHNILVNKNHQYTYKEVEELKPLKQVKTSDKIYILGHCAPGRSAIQSDRVYTNYKNEKEVRYFNYDVLGNILFHYINSKEIILDSQSPPNSLDPLNKLHIEVLGCHSAVDAKLDGSDDAKKEEKDSFTKKFVTFLNDPLYRYNGKKRDKILFARVTGRNDTVNVVYTTSGFFDYLNAILYFLLGRSPFEVGDGFHKRSLDIRPNINGEDTPGSSNWFNQLFFWLPQYQPVFAKTNFEYHSTKYDDYSYGGRQLSNKLKRQTYVNQKVYAFNAACDNLQQAIETRKKIVSNTIGEASFTQAGENLLQKAKEVQNKGWIPKEDLPQLTKVIHETTAIIQNPDKNEYSNDSINDVVIPLTKTSHWKNVIAGAALFLVGSALIALSISAAIASFGASTPASLSGLVLGGSLLSAGMTVGLGMSVGVFAAGVGLFVIKNEVEKKINKDEAKLIHEKKELENTRIC